MKERGGSESVQIHDRDMPCLRMVWVKAPQYSEKWCFPSEHHFCLQTGDLLEAATTCLVCCSDQLGKDVILPSTPMEVELGVLPEGQGVVTHEGLAFAHQEGAILASRLSAVFMQQLLGDLPPITATSQLPMEPFLREVQLVVVELL